MQTSILVIGAYGLVGQSVCKTLFRSGLHVVGVGRDRNRLNEITSFTSETVVADITSPKLTEAVETSCGKRMIEAIVICSGNHADLNEDFVIARAVLSTNIIGIANIVYELIPKLHQEIAPQVIVCSSIMGFVPDRKYPAYAASKAGLNQFINSLRSRPNQRLRIAKLVLGPISKNQDSFGSTSDTKVATKIKRIIRTKGTGNFFIPGFLIFLIFPMKLFPKLSESFLWRLRR
jgi:short-subunit dehydrogenase